MVVNLMNQLEAYRMAYKLALDNAEVWLDLARESFLREHNGQAYSMAVIANEEVVKAYVSWGVSQEYIPPNYEIVTDVYRDHVEKGMISLDFHYEVIVQDFLKAGLIDMEEALGALVTVSSEEVAKTLREHANEMEKRRKAGVYVFRPRRTKGGYSVTSPADFPKTKAENLIEQVSLFHMSIKIMCEAVEKDEKVRDWFENQAEKIDHWRPTDNNT